MALFTLLYLLSLLPIFLPVLSGGLEGFRHLGSLAAFKVNTGTFKCWGGQISLSLSAWLWLSIAVLSKAENLQRRPKLVTRPIDSATLAV